MNRPNPYRIETQAIETARRVEMERRRIPAFGEIVPDENAPGYTPQIGGRRSLLDIPPDGWMKWAIAFIFALLVGYVLRAAWEGWLF